MISRAKKTWLDITLPVRNFFERRRLRNHSVTVISNNCWGGFMLKYHHLPFNTPFIGLFVMPEDYIKILENPELLKTPLHFISKAESRYPDAHENTYPIGVIGDGVEIHFLHYRDEDEARAKWERRVRRINWSNAIVKFSDEVGPTPPELIKRFDSLPYRCKVCFSARPEPGLKSVVVLPDFAGDEKVGATHLVSNATWNFARHANELIANSPADKKPNT